MRKILLFLLILISHTQTVSAEVYNADGFPLNTGASINADITISDLNGDGYKEIVVAPDNRMIYAFKPDGSQLFEYTAGIRMSDQGRIPLVTDFENNGNPEIIVYGNPGVHYSYLHYLNASGKLIQEVIVGMNVIITSPAITRDKIILVGASPGNPAPESGARGVYAYNTTGKKLWYHDIGMVNRYSRIATGDINGDGFDEAGIIIDNGTSDFRLVILEVDRSGGTVLWEKNVGARISGVTFEDINNDGQKDVITGSGAGVFVWNGTGVLLWSNNIPSTTHSVPAIGDINGDGTKEVIIGSDQQKRLYAISNGMMMPGFPVSTIQSVWSSPAIGDLDGDGWPDIATGDYGGYVYAWDNMGRALPGFPFIPAFSSFMSGAIIDDIDIDGISELIIGNNNGRVYMWTMRPKDVIPPVTTDNSDGLWHNNDVLVHLSAVDDISGIEGTYYSVNGSFPANEGYDVLVTEEGISSISYFSIDNAGNIEQMRTATVRIDKSPPSSFIELNESWNNHGVSVNLTAYDGFSGIATISYAIDGSLPAVSYSSRTSFDLSAEGIHNIEYFSMDNASNSENSRNSSIKIDLTPPEINISSPSSRDYLHSDITILNFSEIDRLSGISSKTASINGTEVLNGQPFDMLDLSIGSHEFSLHASDNAGNTGFNQVNFRVIANIDSLIALNDRAIRTGAITSKKVADSLTSKLIQAKQKLNSGDKVKANNLIRSYMNEIDVQRGKTVNPQWADILATEAAYVYILNA